MITNKKALSDVVTTVLIILFAIVAVAIIGGIVLNQVNKAGGKINSATACADLDVSAKVCSNLTAVNIADCKTTGGAVGDKCARVAIMKGGASFKDFSIAGITPIFELKDGTTKTVTEITGAGLPANLNTVTAVLKDTTFDQVSKAGIAVRLVDSAGQAINCDLYKNTKVDCLG